LGQAAYQQAQAQPGGNGPTPGQADGPRDENVVEGEFSEA
jgi:hypothetical protein